MHDLNTSSEFTISLRNKTAGSALDERPRPIRLAMPPGSPPVKTTGLPVRLLVWFLLAFTFQLALYIQSAKSQQLYLAHTTHVLHGDLRAEIDQLAAALGKLSTSALHALVAALFVSVLFRSPFTFQAAPSVDLSLVGATQYLARIYRAPPKN